MTIRNESASPSLGFELCRRSWICPARRHDTPAIWLVVLRWSRPRLPLRLRAPIARILRYAEAFIQRWDGGNAAIGPISSGTPARPRALCDSNLRHSRSAPLPNRPRRRLMRNRTPDLDINRQSCLPIRGYHAGWFVIKLPKNLTARAAGQKRSLPSDARVSSKGAARAMPIWD
jgi:hypothetical protein